MADGNKKLVTQLGIGLQSLTTDVKKANQILSELSTKKININIMDDATKTKALESIRLIKEKLEGMTNVTLDTSKIKSSLDNLSKAFNSVKLNGDVVTQTFKGNSKESQEWANANVKAANTVIDSYNKTQQKIKETTKMTNDKATGLPVSNASTKIVTSASSAELTKITLAYQRLNIEGKTTQQSLLGMASQVQKTTEKYNLQSNALSSANTQQIKYRNEASKMAQAQAQASAVITAAQNKANAQAIKQASATEKQGLAELKLYTQEKAQTSQYAQMSSQLAKISGEANLAMSSSNAGNNMMDRFRISAAYTVATQSIFMLRTAVKDMIDTNRNYEASMVDLGRVVDNVSDKELKLFGKDAINNAKEYGLALQEVQDSYVALAKAGVQKDDLSSMVNTISLGLNTSEISSGSEMAELLTTSLRQMNIEFSQSEKVLDGWNYLADKSTADTADFAQAISKAGATSASMGISIGELNGMIATLSNTTGASGTEIGTAIKAVESRLLRPETLDVLKKYGIETMKDKNHFKDFGDIITQVSGTLDKFGENTVESVEIMDSLGGIMRRNWVSLLARDYGKVDTMAQQSEVDSIGYSAKKSEAAMGTLDKKMKTFNTTIKELYIGLGEGGINTQMKAFVTIGTGMAKAGAWAAPFLLTLGEVSIALYSISGAMKIIKGQNLTQMFDKLNLSWLQSINPLKNSMSFSGSTTSVVVYDAAVKSLQTDIAAGNITMAQSGAILGGLTGKLGTSVVNTNILAAAEGALNIKREGSVALEAALRTQMAESGMTQVQITSAIAARTVTEQSLNQAKAANLITDVEYNTLMKERIVTQTVMNADMANLTMTTNAASIAAKEKASSDLAMKAAQDATAASAKGLKIAMLGVTAALTIGFMVVIPLIMKSIQAHKDLAKNIQSSVDSLRTESDAINGSLADYTELSKKTSLTTEEKDKLTKATQNLIETVPGSSEVINNETLSLEEQTIALTKNAAAKEAASSKKAVEKDVEPFYNKSQQDLPYYKNKVTSTDSVATGKGTDYKKAVSDYIKSVPVTRGGDNKVTEDQAGVIVIKKAKSELQSYKAKLVETQGELDGMNSLITKNVTDMAGSNSINKHATVLLNNEVTAMSKKGKSFKEIDTYAKSSIQVLTQLSKVEPYKAFTASMDKYNSKSTHTVAETKAQVKSLDAFQAAAKKLNLPEDEVALFTQFLKDEKNALNGTSTATKKVEAATMDYATSLSKMTSAVSGAKTEVADLNTTIANLGAGQSLNIDQVVDLITKYPELTNAVHKTANGYTIETKALEALKNVKVQAATATMQAEIDAAAQVLASTKDRLSAYGVEITAIKNLADAKAAANKVTAPTDKEWGFDAGVANKKIHENEKLKSDLTDYGKLLDNMNSLKGMLNSPSLGASSAIESNDKAAAADDKRETAAKTKADKAAAAKEKKEKAAEDKKARQLAAAEKAEAAAKQKHENAVAKAEEKVALAERRVSQAKTEASRKSANEALKVAKAELAAVRLVGATAADIAAAKTQAIRDGTDELAAVQQAQTEAISKAQKKASDLMIEGYQKQIDAINFKNDAEERVTSQLKYQNDIINGQNDLVNAQNQKNVRIYQNGKWQWQSDQTAIKAASQTLQGTETEFAKFKSDNIKTDKIASLEDKIKVEQEKQKKREDITGYANGTDSVPKDDEYLVGENGPEKVRLKKGNQVIPNNKLNAASNNPAISTASAKSAITPNATNTLKKDAKTSLSTIGQSLKTNEKLIKTPVDMLLRNVDTSIDKFVNSAPKYSKDANGNIGKSVKTNDKLVKVPVNNLISDITNSLQTFVNSSPLFGKNTDKNIGNAITANSLSTTMPMDTIITTLRTGIDTFVKNSYNSGTGITTQMGQGITDGSKALTDIVDQLTAKIILQFNTGFGIHSPSKVNNIAVLSQGLQKTQDY